MIIFVIVIFIWMFVATWAIEWGCNHDSINVPLIICFLIIPLLAELATKLLK